MQVIERDSHLWGYLKEDIQGLIEDGEMLLDAVDPSNQNVSDYSYLVFPFAKAYEGFLKSLFLDLGLIKQKEYFSDSIRIGRILNPLFVKKKYSVYARLYGSVSEGKSIAEKLWDTWKKGRNLVFHYFPHNFRKLTFEEALEIIREIVDAMSLSVDRSSFMTAPAREKVSSIL